jgi:hypothetical protein
MTYVADVTALARTGVGSTEPVKERRYRLCRCRSGK